MSKKRTLIPDNKIVDIPKAVEILKNGGIVIFPTDTAFGIGCRIGDRQAVDTLFSLRKRPVSQATPVLISSIPMGLNYAKPLLPSALSFMTQYWPGAVTVVAPCDTEKIYGPVRGHGRTIGLRIPFHAVPLGIISMLNEPILGPSANFHGQQTPYTMEELDLDLVDMVDGVIPGVTNLGSVSTVIQVTQHNYEILRQGAVQVVKPDCSMDFPNLYIDTSDRNITALTLITSAGITTCRYDRGMTASHSLLTLIEQTLMNWNIKATELKSIGVHAGPGSYTGIRIGIAVAKTISFLHAIPINARLSDSTVPLAYLDSKF